MDDTLIIGRAKFDHMELPDVTRVEVIDHYNEVGRAFVFPPADDVRVELSYQDGGKTLKVFLSKNIRKSSE